MGMVLTPKKLVATRTPCTAWLAANSASVGMPANADVYAAAAVSCPVAATVATVPACLSQWMKG